MMRSRVSSLAAIIGLAILLSSPAQKLFAAPAANEYSKHLTALAQLSIDVAQAMPAEKYGFKPHPESMTFGALMAHIATTNYQFCAGLKDTAPPSLPSPTEKDAIVKFLGDSFSYCSRNHRRAQRDTTERASRLS